MFDSLEGNIMNRMNRLAISTNNEEFLKSLKLNSKGGNEI